MFIKKEQNSIEVYLKKNLLDQNFFIFIYKDIKKYTFLKKKDIFLNKLEFLNIKSIKTPLSIKNLIYLKKNDNKNIIILKNIKTVYYNINNYFYNKLHTFIKFLFFKKYIPYYFKKKN